LYQTSHDEGRIANGIYEYNITDHNNDLRVAFKDSLGIAVPTQSIFYDPWGLTMKGMTITRNPTNFNKYQFLNREIQVETGYVDLMNRQYNPQTGQFTSQDRIIDGQEHLSLYQYGWNNPILKPDPNGLEPCCAGVGDFVMGFTHAFNQDVSPVPGTSLVNQEGGRDYSNGAKFGHRAALIVGVIETGGGGAGVLGSGIVEVVSGGLASPAAVPVGLASGGAVIHGIATLRSAWKNLNSEGEKTGRGKNHLEPDKTANGDHSTFRTDPETGKTTNTATYKQNDKNPKTGFDEVKRVDVVGGSHKSKKTGQDIPTPHVHEPKSKDPRPATPSELPRQ
jgi:RHS repeat-associated protein